MSLPRYQQEKWETKFNKMFNKGLEKLKTDDPVFFKRLKTESRQNALASLGIASLEAAHAELVEAEKQINKDKEKIRKNQLAQILNCDVENLEEYRAEHGSNRYYHSNGFESEITEAVNTRKAVEEELILQDSVLGRKVIELEQMKDDMDTAILLATSSTSLKELFAQVCEVLDQPLNSVTESASATPSEVHFGHHEPVPVGNNEGEDDE